MQAILNICAPYVNQLEIKYLKPATDGRNGEWGGRQAAGGVG